MGGSGELTGVLVDLEIEHATLDALEGEIPLAASSAPDSRLDTASLGSAWARRPTALLAKGHSGRRRLVDAGRELRIDDRIPWYGPPTRPIARSESGS
jgi:hypothetical protein